MNAGTTAKPGTNEVVNEVIAATYKVDPPKYSDSELAFRAALIWELCLARDQRDRFHPELDNMTYIEYYESNRKKDLSYLPPKLNPDDIRIVTGTTREKDTTLLNTFLNMNVEPDITAFDENDVVVNELGENMSDMVKKSRDIERYDKKRSIIYREMISQGDVFVQEIYREDFRHVPITDLHWDPNKDGVSDFSIKERLQKIFEGCECRMINGKKIYLGNIRHDLNDPEQQLCAVLNVIPRAVAEARYRNWERWKNVPYVLETMTTFYDDGHTYKDWNLVTLNDRDKVAEIFVYWKERNRFMILLNGVMMLPIDFPLTAISLTGDFSIAQGRLEPISDFAYSKSIPAKTKIKQEVLDEITRLMIQKARQSFRPPMGSSGRKVYSTSIFNAGRVTTDIKEGELFPIFGANFTGGITAPDFQFYNAVKAQIDDETTTPEQGGASPQPGTPTKSTPEAQSQANNQILQLALQLDSLVNLERTMVWNRIYNILAHWTNKVDDSIDNVKQGVYDGYRSFMTNSHIDGRAGHRLFRMTNKPFPPIADHEQEEGDLSRQYNRPVRITYLNAEMLRTIKFKWFIQITPSPKADDKLSALLFTQNLQQAISIFGPQSINQEYAKQEWAHVNRYDYNKFFMKGNIAALLNPGGPATLGMPAAQTGALGPGKAPTDQQDPAAAGMKVSPQMAAGAKGMAVAMK